MLGNKINASPHLLLSKGEKKETSEVDGSSLVVGLRVCGHMCASGG